MLTTMNGGVMTKKEGLLVTTLLDTIRSSLNVKMYPKSSVQHQHLIQKTRKSWRIT